MDNVGGVEQPKRVVAIFDVVARSPSGIPREGAGGPARLAGHQRRLRSSAYWTSPRCWGSPLAVVAAIVVWRIPKTQHGVPRGRARAPARHLAERARDPGGDRRGDCRLGRRGGGPRGVRYGLELAELEDMTQSARRRRFGEPRRRGAARLPRSSGRTRCERRCTWRRSGTSSTPTRGSRTR